VRKEYERHRNDLNIDFKYSEFGSGLYLQGARFARACNVEEGQNLGHAQSERGGVR
jgi:hypothetical protein